MQEISNKYIHLENHERPYSIKFRADRIEGMNKLYIYEEGYLCSELFRERENL